MATAILSDTVTMSGVVLALSRTGSVVHSAAGAGRLAFRTGRVGFAAGRFCFVGGRVGFAAGRLDFEPEYFDFAAWRIGFAAGRLDLRAERFDFAEERLGFAMAIWGVYEARRHRNGEFCVCDLVK